MHGIWKVGMNFSESCGSQTLQVSRPLSAPSWSEWLENILLRFIPDGRSFLIFTSTQISLHLSSNSNINPLIPTQLNLEIKFSWVNVDWYKGLICWTAESFWRSGPEGHTIKEILEVNCILGTQKPIQQWRWQLTLWFEDATWSCLITWSLGQCSFPTGSSWWCISTHICVDRGCVRRQHSSLCCTWSCSVVSPGEGADMWSKHLALALANHVSQSKVLPLPCRASVSSPVSWLSKLIIPEVPFSPNILPLSLHESIWTQLDFLGSKYPTRLGLQQGLQGLGQVWKLEASSLASGGWFTVTTLFWDGNWGQPERWKPTGTREANNYVHKVRA